MKPLRMCMVCRERKEKSQLIRLVKKSPDGAALDLSGKAEGRGVYFCKDGDCINQAEKRRCLERAFSCKIDSAVYAELLQTKENTNE